MIAAAVLFAAIAGVLVFVALQNRGGDEGTTSLAPTTEVVVAARTIDTNTKLSADMLELTSVPSDQVLTGAYTSIDLAVGLPLRYPVQKGEQVTTSKIGLEAIQDEKDLALVLEPGKRGFSVLVSEVTGVGGLLLPGNVVDVIAVFPEGPAGITKLGDIVSVQDIQDIKAVTLLQNIEVLGVAQEAQEPVPAAAPGAETGGEGEAAEDVEVGQGIRGQRPEDVERQPGARSVTLAVTPDQAQLLALVQETAGIIWLSLRPVGEPEGAPPDETNLLPLISAPLPRK